MSITPGIPDIETPSTVVFNSNAVPGGVAVTVVPGQTYRVANNGNDDIRLCETAIQPRGGEVFKIGGNGRRNYTVPAGITTIILSAAVATAATVTLLIITAGGGGGGNTVVSTYSTVSFPLSGTTVTVPLDGLKQSARQTVASALAFTPNLSGAVVGGKLHGQPRRGRGERSDLPRHGALDNSAYYSNVAGIENRIVITYDGNNALYTIVQDQAAVPIAVPQVTGIIIPGGAQNTIEIALDRTPDPSSLPPPPRSPWSTPRGA
jgi:hypothetical protein